MTIVRNCRSLKQKNKQCKYLIPPLYQSGWTGKSGMQTQWMCDLKKCPIKKIKDCEFSFANKDKDELNFKFR